MLTFAISICCGPIHCYQKTEVLIFNIELTSIIKVYLPTFSSVKKRLSRSGNLNMLSGKESEIPFTNICIHPVIVSGVK